MSGITINKSVLFVMLFAFQGLACAADCGDSSPSKSRELSLTSEINPRDLTRAEVKQLTKLYKFLEGHWQGSADEIVCKGNTAAAKQEAFQYTVDVNIDVDHLQQVTLLAELYSRKKKTTRQEKLELYLVKNRLRLSSEAKSGDVEVLSITDQFLAFFKKIVERSVAGGVIAQEVIISIARYGNTLKIEFLVYTHGALTSQNVWTLKRK